MVTHFTLDQPSSAPVISDYRCSTLDLITFKYKSIDMLGLFHRHPLSAFLPWLLLWLLIWAAEAEVMNCGFLAPRHQPLSSTELVSVFVLGFHASHVLIMLYLPCPISRERYEHLPLLYPSFLIVLFVYTDVYCSPWCVNNDLCAELSRHG